MSYIHKKPKKYSTIVGTSSQRKTKEKNQPLLFLKEIKVYELDCLYYPY